MTIDIEALIAEARFAGPPWEDAQVVTLIGDLADALESVAAERDAALGYLISLTAEEGTEA